MFKLMGKEINAILGAQTILIWTYDFVEYPEDRFSRNEAHDNTSATISPCSDP